METQADVKTFVKEKDVKPLNKKKNLFFMQKKLLISAFLE